MFHYNAHHAPEFEGGDKYRLIVEQPILYKLDTIATSLAEPDHRMGMS